MIISKKRLEALLQRAREEAEQEVLQRIEIDTIKAKLDDLNERVCMLENKDNKMGFNN